MHTEKKMWLWIFDIFKALIGNLVFPSFNALLSSFLKKKERKLKNLKYFKSLNSSYKNIFKITLHLTTS